MRIARSAGGRRARDLERVEAAPGVAHHPDPPGAPRLGGEPGDHLHRVVLLQREVLVGEHALRVAAAAHVDADARVAVPGDVGMRERVPLRGPLAPAVREVLEDRRHRARLGVDREPHARREPRPVLQRDPDRITPLDRAREHAHGGHGAALYRLVCRPERPRPALKTPSDEQSQQGYAWGPTLEPGRRMTLSRRALVVGVTLALLATTLAVGAQQQKVPRIGLLETGSFAARAPLWEAFRPDDARVRIRRGPDRGLRGPRRRRSARGSRCSRPSSSASG